MPAGPHGIYIQCISTRSVDALVKAMGMTGISKSQVSRLCAEIDGKISTSLYTLEQLARHLGVAVKGFFDDRRSRSPAPKPSLP